MHIAPLFIATGLATILAGNIAVVSVGHAATMNPRDATMILARSQVLDSRCKILSASESQDLRDLVARAEIALASKYSVAVARATLAKGRAQGKAAACDATASAQVRDILKAGMQATSLQPVAPKTEQSAAPAKVPQTTQQVATSQPTAPAKEPKLVAHKKVAKAQKPVAPVKIKQKPAVRKVARTITRVKPEKKASLASYSSLAEKYYAELKCRDMPMSSAKRMYKEVLKQHRAAMASEGASAVRKMLKNAQSRAGSQSCS